MFESGEDDTADLNLLKVRKFATKCPLNPDGVQFKTYNFINNLVEVCNDFDYGQRSSRQPVSSDR